MPEVKKKFEATIILTLEPDDNNKRKENFRPVLLMKL